jgi:3-deoxy-D-manno-octulosonic-acid transferase
MSFIHLAYNLIGNACAAVAIPPMWAHQVLRKRDLSRFYQRLGCYPEPLHSRFHGYPRVWLHAVSVGEVGVAVSIIRSLKILCPNCQIALSTATEQGIIQANALAGRFATCFFAPLDLSWATRKAMLMVKPQVLALLETEIWPNLITTAHQMGCRVAMINGRISVRAINGYRRIKPLMRHTLPLVDTFSMISDDDAARITSIGAPSHCIRVNGNAKFDGPDPYADAATERWASEIYNLKPTTPVFVAGSTRSAEELILLDAFLTVRKAFPETVLIIAPRHIDRSDQIEAWAKAKGLECQRRTQLDASIKQRVAQVVILDTIGELTATYSIANFVFCGGSLVHKGGQNILEPAMWGKPVMHGPSMEDFADAQKLLHAAGGSVKVASGRELASVALEWLRNPEKARAIGQAARRAILSHRGAAHNHAAEIVRLLNS